MWRTRAVFVIPEAIGKSSLNVSTNALRATSYTTARIVEKHFLLILCGFSTGRLL
jgi:hypothetical protein